MRRLSGIAGVMLVACVAFGQVEAAKKDMSEAYTNALEKTRSKDRGAIEQGIADLDAIAKDSKASPREKATATASKGWAYGNIQKFVEASEAFETALAEPTLTENEKRVWSTSLGRILELRGKFAESQAAYEAAVPKVPPATATDKLKHAYAFARARDNVSVARVMKRQDKVADANALMVTAMLDLGRINLWTPEHQKMFEAITVTAGNEAEYRDFCKKLHFLILPVEENVQVKTLLRRIAEGQ